MDPDQLNAILAGVIAGLVIKGADLALAGLKKLAAKTETKLDDNLLDAIVEAVKAKAKK